MSATNTTTQVENSMSDMDIRLEKVVDNKIVPKRQATLSGGEVIGFRNMQKNLTFKKEKIEELM